MGVNLPANFPADYLSPPSGYNWIKTWQIIMQMITIRCIFRQRMELSIKVTFQVHFIFKSLTEGSAVSTFQIPWNNTTTSNDLLQGPGLFTNMTYNENSPIPSAGPINLAAQDFDLILEGGWVTGLIPSQIFTEALPLSREYMQQHLADFIMFPILQLSPNGQSLGPWFYYDKGVHPLSGNTTNNVIYAYPWDDNYYPISVGGYF